MRGGVKIQRQKFCKSMIEVKEAEGGDITSNYDAINKVKIFDLEKVISN